MIKPKVEVKMEPNDFQMTSSSSMSATSGVASNCQQPPQGGQFPTSLENLLGKGGNTTPQPPTQPQQIQIDPTSGGGAGVPTQTSMTSHGNSFSFPSENSSAIYVKDEPLTTMETESAANSRKSSVCSVTVKEEIKVGGRELFQSNVLKLVLKVN